MVRAGKTTDSRYGLVNEGARFFSRRLLRLQMSSNAPLCIVPCPRRDKLRDNDVDEPWTMVSVDEGTRAIVEDGGSRPS